MKSKVVFIIVTLLTVISICGCGGTDSPIIKDVEVMPTMQVTNPEKDNPVATVKPDTEKESQESNVGTVKPDAGVVGGGVGAGIGVGQTSNNSAGSTENDTPIEYYNSELTNELINKKLQNQRPIAVMVDNEKTAYDHYGVNEADVVYELMNSTANDRITRLMCIFKDYENVVRIGSVRSTRPTNILIAHEWDAILCHDGGPFYVDDYFARDLCSHLSGGFARYTNGKAYEFTEYITNQKYTNSETRKSYDSLVDRIDAAGLSRDYTPRYNGHMLSFDDDLSIRTWQSISSISMPFYHTSSTLIYNSESKTFDYWSYGKPHKDAATQEVLTFDNVIIISVPHTVYDDHGYMIYNVVGSGEGYYLRDGKYIGITWSRESENGHTTFKFKDGTSLMLKTGTTYIAYVPSDTWAEVSIK